MGVFVRGVKARLNNVELSVRLLLCFRYGKYDMLNCHDPFSYVIKFLR